MEKANGAIWRKSLFRKIGEDGVSSFASRMTQGIFVRHHDRTGAVLCITKNGVVRGKSWTRQTLSDAWESTNWEGLCGTPWQMVALELKLTKKVTAEKGAGTPLPRIVVERSPELEPRRFYVLSADIEAHGHTGGYPGCAVLASQRSSIKSRNNECRERIRTIIERTLTGKARMNACKDRIAETERVKERKRARVERFAGDVPMEPTTRDDERMAFRHADASCGYIIENQHEEKRKRDIRISVFRSTCCSGISLIGRDPYLCRSQVMLMTTNKFPLWMCSSRWMDISIEEKMLEISREVN